MSLTMTQSKFNSANQQAYPIQPIVSRTTMPFSKRNFSSMTLSTNTYIPINRNIQSNTNVNINQYIRQPPMSSASVARPHRDLLSPNGHSNPGLPSEARPSWSTIIANDDAKKPKMLWGKPTWYLLHMMAEKIQESRFQEIRQEFLNIIFLICSNLPCPTCAVHAKQYLERVKYQWIYTKEQLKQMLFIFHNDVNSRKGYAHFMDKDLDNLYSKSNPPVIIQNFINEFNRKNKSVRLLADDMNRQRIIDTLKVWFNKNITFFTAPLTLTP